MPKSLGIANSDALIAAAIAYRQHPRNADDIGGGVVPSTPYCTEPPRNPELVGIANEQLPGVDPGLYGGPNAPMVAFGEGIYQIKILQSVFQRLTAPFVYGTTCPAGMTPDVPTCPCT